MRLGPRSLASWRVICVPHAGASASAYRHWPAAFGDDVEVLGVQLPGRETRMFEAAIPSLPDVVSALMPEVRSWLDRPFVLFGHSMGALIAYELARALAASGDPAPAALVVSACAAPHRPGRRPRIARLSDADVLAALRALGAAPNDALAHPEFAQLMMPTLRADITLCESYEWRPPGRVTCPLIALGGRADRSVRRADLEQWAVLTTAEFHVQTFAGDHFYLERSTAPVAAAIRAHARPHSTALTAPARAAGAVAAAIDSSGLRSRK